MALLARTMMIDGRIDGSTVTHARSNPNPNPNPNPDPDPIPNPNPDPDPNPNPNPNPIPNPNPDPDPNRLLEAFTKTDEDLLDTDEPSGSCAVVVVLHDSSLYIAHSGDCRALLCSGEKWEAVRLTEAVS